MFDDVFWKIFFGSFCAGWVLLGIVSYSATKKIREESMISNVGISLLSLITGPIMMGFLYISLQEKIEKKKPL
ncbi:MAG: hypothetical protein R3B60_03000 [Candidatus Paceibacterota bacterium]